MTTHRRKGVAIVETREGVLVVAGRSKKFMLPGGGAEKGESRKKAAIRELNEETGLKTKDIHYLFSYVGKKWHTHSGRSIRNFAKVFLIEAEGHARPRHEIRYIDYYKPGKNIRISHNTRLILDKYLENS